MAHFAAQIEVLSNGEAEREKITNYDEVQTTWPTVPTPKLWTSMLPCRQRAGESLKCVGLEQFPAEGQQLSMFQVFVVLHKGAITEVILIYDLNARDFFYGDAKFSRNFAWGWQIL